MKKARPLRLNIVIPTIIMFVVFTILLIGVVRFTARRTIETFIYDDIYTKQEDMYQGMTMVLDEINLLYSRILLSEFTDTIVNDETLSEQDKQALFEDAINQAGVNWNLFERIVLVHEDSVLQDNTDTAFEPVPLSFQETTFESSRIIEFHTTLPNQDRAPHLLFGKKVGNAYSGDSDTAVFFYVKESAFRTFYDNIDPSLGASFILDSSNTVISHSKGEFVGSTLYDAGTFSFESLPDYTVQTIDGEETIIIVNENQSFSNQYQLDWRIVSALSYNTLYSSVLELDRYILILGILMGLLAVGVSLGIARKISKPIQTMVENLRSFSKTGSKAAFKPLQNSLELEELETTYESMLDQIVNLIEHNRQKAESQRKLELYTLQMQINPHSLYNTLDTIAWMAKIKDQKEIENLVLALAKFFRLSLHKGDKYVEVGEEVELVSHFIDIELIRFPDKFTVEYHIDDTIKHVHTLKLLLQPIVENAIKHGISQLERKGHISISAKADGPDIVFEVSDNGIGFNPKPDHFKKNRPESMNGYGLKNVDDRIKLEYGDAYGVWVDSKPKGGTKVTLRIKKPE